MVKSHSIDIKTDSDGKLNKLQIDGKINVQYVYDGTSHLLQQLILTRADVTTAELIDIINKKWLDRINLIDLINTIVTINDIKNIDVVKLVDEITEIDLIDRVTLIDRITKIDDVALIDRITLIDEITKIDTITTIDSVTAANVTVTNLSATGVARAFPFDRNASTVTETASGSVNNSSGAPHTFVQFTYTVPANKKALIQLGNVLSQQTTGAGTIISSSQITLNGSILLESNPTSTLGLVLHTNSLALQIYIFTGDVVIGQVYTSGNCDVTHQEIVELMVFDA